MKEDFLHYIWRYGLYTKSTLKTVQKEKVLIVKPGQYNTNTGSDFLEGELIIDGQKWIGNIEIHLNASDWYHHQHEKDSNYDAIILHVVWNHDVEIYMKDNRPLPTLELRNFVPQELLLKYGALYKSESRWIPCENQIRNAPLFTVKHWLERLYFERLEQKTAIVEALLKRSKNDWEALLFQMLAKSFGSNVNGGAMLTMAQSVEMAMIRKEKHDSLRLSALLYGQAGLLNEQMEDAHYAKLKEEYMYLRQKYRLKSIEKTQLQFFRMRPHNFPTIRIAQLVGLYNQKSHLFASVIAAKEMKEYYKIFDIRVTEYWKSHFNFGKKSRVSSKKITKSFINLLVINTILPLKFYYLKNIGKLDEAQIIHLITKVKSEKNSILDKFSELGIKPNSAMESQALIELKNNYCAPKRCLECAIGNSILSKN